MVHLDCSSILFNGNLWLCNAACCLQKNASNRTELKHAASHLTDWFYNFFPDINNEYVQLFNTKNMVKLCFTCWKKQQKKKRGKKKAKHQRAQIATIAQAVQMALKMWGKNTASYIPIACIRWKSTLIRKSPQNGKGQKSRLQWGHTLKYNTACFCCCCCCCLLFLNTGI